jgi:DNA end-binding protein Ku
VPLKTILKKPIRQAAAVRVSNAIEFEVIDNKSGARFASNKADPLISHWRTEILYVKAAPMNARPTWKGYLKLSLVSIPVKAFSVADSGSGDIQLNQLHAECNSRIQYKKTCPVHGEVPNDEIISGYKVGKDQYVPIAKDDLEAIRTKSDQAIEIATFISEDQLDDRFLTERSYYLVPDGKVAQKPYALIRESLSGERLRAIAEVVLSQREQHVIVRPLGSLLIMTVLQHQQELKTPTGFEDHVDDVDASAQELKLTKQLVDGMTQVDWDFSKYKDSYQQRLSELIAAKVEGKEMVKPPETEAPTIINLMDALKASIEQIPLPGKKSESVKSAKEATTKAHADSKPAKRAAASTARAASKRQSTKKTG